MAQGNIDTNRSDNSNSIIEENKKFNVIEFGRKYGEKFVDLLICASAIFICCGKYIVSREVFITIDCTFTLIFLLEAIIKILYCCRIVHIESQAKDFFIKIREKYEEIHSTEDWEVFKEKEWEKYKNGETLGTHHKLWEGFKLYLSSNWNKFDFTITLLALPSVAFVIFPHGYLSGSSILIFRLFRMMRVFRLFHLIKRHKNGVTIMKSIREAFKTSIVVIIGFIITVFVLAIVNFSLFKNVTPEYFGNPIISMYNTFRLFTLEGWYEIPNEIADRCPTEIISGFAKLYFCTILFLGGIMGVSMVTSMFVDALNKDDHEATQKEIRKAQEEIKTARKEIKDLTSKIDQLTALLEEQNKLNSK